jgi:predicted homoserine dehydrogenase-like protein
MDRRDFLQASAATLALSTTTGLAAAFADSKPQRVGLIGTGWYGKCDLLRLLQVAPVEVVSLCDVDRKAGSSRRRSHALMVIIARCSRKRTSTSC